STRLVMGDACSSGQIQCNLLAAVVANALIRENERFPGLQFVPAGTLNERHALADLQSIQVIDESVSLGTLDPQTAACKIGAQGAGILVQSCIRNRESVLAPVGVLPPKQARPPIS